MESVGVYRDLRFIFAWKSLTFLVNIRTVVLMYGYYHFILFYFVETPRIIYSPKLSIRKPGLSSVEIKSKFH